MVRRRVRVKERFIAPLRAGIKRWELRCRSPMFNKLNVDDIIVFYCDSQETSVRIIKRMEVKTFREFFDRVDVQDVVPSFRGSADDVIQQVFYDEFKMKKKESDYEVVGFEIQPVPDPTDSSVSTTTVSVSPSINDEGKDTELVLSDQRKRKGRNEYRRRLRKKLAQQVNQRTTTGFTTCSRRKFKTRCGTRRTCVQDALFHGCISLGISVEYSKIIKNTLPGVVGVKVGDRDTSMKTIIDYVPTLGLQCVSVKTFMTGKNSLWQLPGGVMVNLLRLTVGVFLIHLKIYCTDGDTDNHMVEYNANLGRITDNNRDADVVLIDDNDRVSSSNAYKVFYYFFPHSKYMEVSNVYQLSCM